MEAAGALGAVAPILKSISNPPGGAGWSLFGFNGCHVAQNIVRCSNFFCGLCLMSLKSVSVKLWRDFKAK